MTYQIRHRVAVPEDATALAGMLETACSVLMARHYDAATLRAALPSLARPNPVLLASGGFYVAEDDDAHIVACGGWSAERPGSGETVPGLAHIRHFATHPAVAGRGIGRRLYAVCEAAARAAGVARFECHASLNAEGFYAALGFTSVGTITIPIAGGFPAVVMTRTI